MNTSDPVATLAPLTHDRRRRLAPAFIFARHYAEMVAAMLLGMLVLGAGFTIALSPLGVDVATWNSDAPALALLGMGFTMTAPMVAWMRHRGHGFAAGAEMSAAMIVPTLAAVLLLWSGAVTDIHTLMMIEHVAMFPGMFAAMLLRLPEYTHPIG
jgi:hypothetical protein